MLKKLVDSQTFGFAHAAQHQVADEIPDLRNNKYPLWDLNSCRCLEKAIRDDMTWTYNLLHPKQTLYPWATSRKKKQFLLKQDLNLQLYG